MEQIEQARLRVSAHHIVQLVAVSKYSTTEAIAALYKQGQRAFGENKVQDLEAKADILSDLPLEWHFLGNLQKNKINKLIDLAPDLVHSVSSLELAKELQQRLAAKNSRMEALLQINSAKEATKGGVMPEAAADIYREIRATCPNLNLCGVMTIGAHTEEEAVIKKSFETTHAIYDALQNDGATVCSMGMSNDFELAIACGSTMVRLGSILFK
jgi:hypothetical protein